MSLYSNGMIKSVIIDPTHYRANVRASFKLDGVSQTAYTSVSEGFHLAEFSSSADYNLFGLLKFGWHYLHLHIL